MRFQMDIIENHSRYLYHLSFVRNTVMHLSTMLKLYLNFNVMSYSRPSYLSTILLSPLAREKYHIYSSLKTFGTNFAILL
jgi:hypothetical protein